ncbi:MAG: DUF2220 family protein [Pseudolabrys sp.]|nr:DUF2220 family protein [Pseudolabrys sp.]MDP2296983.1 DUF2220 family protein [Pseudolabrys sp.]
MSLIHSTPMNMEAALDEPLISRIFARALDRLDSQPAAGRTHRVRINLDEAMAPEIHHADSLAARDVAWAAVDGIVEATWGEVGYRLHRKHGAREERQPYLDISWSDDVEDLIRSKLRRPRKGQSYFAQWRALVEGQNLVLPEAVRAQLAAMPIVIAGRPVEDVFARFLSVREIAGEQLLLREVSSRIFWGLSKVLDGRADAVAALLEADECPFPEQPVVLNVHLSDQPTSFLFVENHVSFERLKQRSDVRKYALIFSSGFRGAAARLRKAGRCSVYYTRNSPSQSIVVFEEALFSTTDIPTFFWGDLDFSGMAILATLRSTFASAQAWEPGYAPMLARLMCGDGHSPAESGKERQRVVERTGCPYADETLIPALKSTGQFVDQE